MRRGGERPLSMSLVFILIFAKSRPGYPKRILTTKKTNKKTIKHSEKTKSTRGREKLGPASKCVKDRSWR